MESSIKKSTDVKKFYDFVNNNSKIKLSEDINKLETELNNYIEKNKNIFFYKDNKYEKIVSSIFEEVFFIKKILTYHSHNSLNTTNLNFLSDWVQNKYCFIEKDENLRECLNFIITHSFKKSNVFNEDSIINFVLGIKYVYKESSQNKDEITFKNKILSIILEFKIKDFSLLHSKFTESNVSVDDIKSYFFEKYLKETSLINFMNKINSLYLNSYFIHECRRHFLKKENDDISLDVQNEEGNSDNDKLQLNAIGIYSDFSNNDFSPEYISNIFYEIWITEEKSLINIRKMMCYFLLYTKIMNSKDFMESLSIKNQSIVTSIEHDLNFDLSFLKNNSIKEYIKVLIQKYQSKIKKSNLLEIKKSEPLEFNKYDKSISDRKKELAKARDAKGQAQLSKFIDPCDTPRWWDDSPVDKEMELPEKLVEEEKNVFDSFVEPTDNPEDPKFVYKDDKDCTTRLEKQSVNISVLQEDKINFVEFINVLINFANEIDRRSSDKKLAIDFENCLKENNIPDDFIHKSNYINVIHILNALKTKEYLISLRKKLNLSEIELIDFQETIFSIITNKISNPNDAKKKIRDFINTKKTNISSLDELVKDIHEKIFSCGELITKKIYPENIDYQDLKNYSQSYSNKVSLFLPKISGLFFQNLLKNDSFENKSNKEKNSLTFHFFINYFSPYIKNLVKLNKNNLLFIKTKNIDVFKSYFKNNSEEKSFEVFKVLYNEKDNKIFIEDFIYKDNITLT